MVLGVNWEQIKKAFTGETKEEKIARVRHQVKALVPEQKLYDDVKNFLSHKPKQTGNGRDFAEMDVTVRNFAEDVLDYATACVDPTRGWFDVSEIPEKMRSDHYKVEDVHRFIGQHIYGSDGYFSIVVNGNNTSRYTKYGSMTSGFRGP